MKTYTIFFIGFFLLTGCGIGRYPGQPGVVTDGYSKIDLEDLHADGLWVYEVSYDNRPSGKGVGAIVTRLYPKARTYTSNVRTNSHGTLYRNKTQYEGSEIQMISLPGQNQVLIPPGSKVVFLLQYALSLDEIDNKNISEQNLFTKHKPSLLTRAALFMRQFRFDLMRSARLLPSGNLSFEVASLELGGKIFTPHDPVRFETNFFQTGMRSQISEATQKEAAQFLETNYPKGYRGIAKLVLKGSEKPLLMEIGIHTLKTAEASGTTIIRNVSEAKITDVVNQFAKHE